MTPRDLPTRSRLRARPRRCALERPAANPRRVVACSDVDGAAHVARWAPGPKGAVAMPLPSPAWGMALAQPIAGTIFTRARARRLALSWDLDAGERAFVAVELYSWPFPPGWDLPLPVRAFVGRARVEAPPLRQVGVAGDLAAALAELGDAPRWVGPAERLERVRAVIETPGSSRAQMRAALGAT